MSDDNNYLNFVASSPNRSMTGREYIAAVRACLRGIAEIDGRLSSLYILPRKFGGIKKSPLMAIDDPGLDAEIIKNLDHEVPYWEGERGVGDGNFTLDARSIFGFSSWFATTTNDRKPHFSIQFDFGQNKEPYAIGTRDRIHFRITEDSEFAAIAKDIFVAVVEQFRPGHAAIWRPSVKAYPSQPLGTRMVGWLTYFDREEIAKLVPAGVQVEQLSDGILIQAAEQAPFPEDEAACAAIARVFHALQPHGVLERPGAR